MFVQWILARSTGTASISLCICKGVLAVGRYLPDYDRLGLSQLMDLEVKYVRFVYTLSFIWHIRNRHAFEILRFVYFRASVKSTKIYRGIMLKYSLHVKLRYLHTKLRPILRAYIWVQGKSLYCRKRARHTDGFKPMLNTIIFIATGPLYEPQLCTRLCSFMSKSQQTPLEYFFPIKCPSD